ncbi:hypothetical protein COCON_G00008330 [Conger conger]|uniref:Src-like-adapter n=1 Tax=Conger conger TaxID=82655 RepID=A0A9Q1E2L9_CONCO|nr:src-like-adapter [Conger conger]XP_061095097.1 src-like-adapter [Conger conger]KAJ8288174.1 hypothetical protein COCON_G00008330 [Conger conger]
MMGNSSTNLVSAPEPEDEDDRIFADPLTKSTQPSMKEVPDGDTLVVIHDYPAPHISQPIFRTGEKLRVISQVQCWWRVHSITTGKENYIPQNHIAKVYHGWLFEGVTRQKAEELLHLPGNKAGSFMIRESTKEKGVYSLSVRNRTIKHYRIFRLPNNWYYISPRLTFQCLEDLVNHYSDIADGLSCILSAPCLALTAGNLNLTNQEPPMVMRCNFDWQNVQRSELLKESTQRHPENVDSLISFGVRNSIASYLSLVESQDTTQKGQHKKNNKSIYSFPDNKFDATKEEDCY